MGFVSDAIDSIFGTDDQPQSPAAPAMQTTAQSMQDYVANLPAMYQAQLEYSPKFNQQQYEQAAKFAPLMKQLQDTMYPNTSAMPEKLATAAAQGMQNGMPQYMKDMYADQYRAEIGTQAGSGIGSDYVSRQMLNQNEQYKQYYQNMGLSVAGMQPLSQSNQYQQAYTPSSSYSYGQVANNNATNYGNYMQGYSSMYNTNGQVLNNNTNARMQGFQMASNFAGGMMM